MRKTRIIADSINSILTPKRIAVLLGILFFLTLLPILYVAPAVRATGDDLGYSYSVRHAIVNGWGLTGILSAVANVVRSTWYSWQGTWSSLALFSLQPGIWGDEWYPLTVPIALLSILIGLWYFLSVLLRRFGFPSAYRWIVFFLTAILVIQYMPNERGGIFWWTSVAHYSISFGAAMLTMGWSLRWLDTGRVRFCIGTILLMTYLGGAGYPALVLSAVWCFLMILCGLSGLAASPVGGNRRRALLLILPLLLLMIGFGISAAAPGNTNRAGEGFGFSISRVISTLVACMVEGLSGDLGYFLTVRPLLPVLIVIAFFSWEMADTTKFDADRLWHPLLVLLAGLGITCIVRAPEIYAGTDVSGGVPDTYWYVSMTALSLITAWVSAWCRARYEKRADAQNTTAHDAMAVSEEIVSGSDKQVHSGAAALRSEKDLSAGKPDRETGPAGSPLTWSPTVLIVMGLVCLLLYRHIIGSTVDYSCVTYAQSGALADYREQMGEWLELLNDPTLDEVELPSMNSDQGPFMMMVPTADTKDFTSRVYALYYGKNSVTMTQWYE